MDKDISEEHNHGQRYIRGRQSSTTHRDILIAHHHGDSKGRCAGSRFGHDKMCEPELASKFVYHGVPPWVLVR